MPPRLPLFRIFARHHETRQVLPRELVTDMLRAKSFGGGLGQAAQSIYAKVSLWYHRAGPQVDLYALAQSAWERATPVPYPTDSHWPCAFLHLEMMDTKYYTYLWSSAIAKDMFTQFSRDDLLDPTPALRYKKMILEPGSSLSAAQLVRNFLGLLPSACQSSRHHLPPYLRPPPSGHYSATAVSATPSPPPVRPTRAFALRHTRPPSNRRPRAAAPRRCSTARHGPGGQREPRGGGSGPSPLQRVTLPPSHSSLKECALERVQPRGSWRVAVLHKSSKRPTYTFAEPTSIGPTPPPPEALCQPPPSPCSHCGGQGLKFAKLTVLSRRAHPASAPWQPLVVRHRSTIPRRTHPNSPQNPRNAQSQAQDLPSIVFLYGCPQIPEAAA